mmetsp:Transcript_42495/g.98491  ORF Transcript_42495/g.98491 Transcript_42495/m.98491 type:complete len:407 (-) Transcript_42495:261-1481(-)
MSTLPTKSTSVFEELELFPGDFVKARYVDNDFYLATVELDKQTGDFTLRWCDTGEVCRWLPPRRQDIQLLEGRSRSGKAVQFFPGDVVWAHWEVGWYLATLEKGHSDGTFTLQWADNSVFDTSTHPGLLKGVPFYHRGHRVRFFLTESSQHPETLEVSLDESVECRPPTAQTVPPSSREEPSSESELSGEEEEEEEEPCFVEQATPAVMPIQTAEPSSTETPPVKTPDAISDSSKSNKWSKLVINDSTPLSFASAEPMPEPAPSVRVEEKPGGGRDLALVTSSKKPSRSPLRRSAVAMLPQGSGQPLAAKLKNRTAIQFVSELQPEEKTRERSPPPIAGDCPTFPMHEDEPSTEEEDEEEEERDIRGASKAAGGKGGAVAADRIPGEQLELESMYEHLASPARVWG